MKQVVLDSVCLENFRSFTAPTAINFSAAPGLKLVSGANLVEPTLGANGAGKSTVFDAVAYALYGASVKGLRHGDLRSYDSRRMAVLLLLQVDGEMVAIQRTAPAERITIDKRPATQADIDELVGLSEPRFLNSVIFGQGQPLFIDLAKPARGDLLDEVLQLEVWLEAAQRALARHHRETAELTELRVKCERLDAALAAQPDLGELKALEGAWDNERDERLRDLIERYEAVEAEISQLAEASGEAPITRDMVDEAKRLYDEQRDYESECRGQFLVLQTQHRKLRDDIEFLATHEECPTCNQPLTPEFRHDHTERLAGEEAACDLAVATARTDARDAADKTRELETAWRKIIERQTQAQHRLALAQTQRDGKRRESDDLQRQAVRVKNEKNPYSEQRQEAVAERRRLTAALTEARVAEQAKAAQLASIGYWRQGFRRCRAFCLENVLRELSLETHNSLLALGLPGWQVDFSTGDPDAKRLGVEVEVRPPAHQAGRRFEIFSGGEGQRARLAASLGLASLVQRWAGVRWNFEFFDEPTAWLSEEGVEDLLDALATRAEITGRSIYLADHRALQNAGFVESYLVTKDAKGSRWERV